MQGKCGKQASAVLGSSLNNYMKPVFFLKTCWFSSLTTLELRNYQIQSTALKSMQCCFFQYQWEPWTHANGRNYWNHILSYYRFDFLFPYHYTIQLEITTTMCKISAHVVSLNVKDLIGSKYFLVIIPLIYVLECSLKCRVSRSWLSGARFWINLVTLGSTNCQSSVLSFWH